MKDRFLIVLLFLPVFFAGNFAGAQGVSVKTPDSAAATAGNVVIHQDPGVDMVVKKHIEYNRQQKGIPGYRVQIFFDAGNNSLDRATKVAREFQLLFPGDTAYIQFNEPYYKVRVGDFRTRLDAVGFLYQVLPDYPNAFVIKDKINFPGQDQ